MLCIFDGKVLATTAVVFLFFTVSYYINHYLCLIFLVNQSEHDSNTIIFLAIYRSLFQRL